MAPLAHDPSGFLMEPPEGQTRTLGNPPSSGSGVIPCGVTTTIIASIIVILRVFTRRYVVKSVLGADDYLCIAGLCFSFIFLGITLTLLNLGAGNHMWDIPVAEYVPKFWQTSIGATLTYAASISLAKLSVLSFYLRISPDRFVRRAVHVLMALVCSYTFVYICLVVFRCQPVSAGWDLTIEGKCIEMEVLVIFLVICSVVIDTFVLLLPIRIVQPLQIPTRQKISLAVLFATGGVIIVVTIRRATITLPILDAPDYTWALPRQLILSFIEVNTSLVCVSVPALKPFCVRYIPFLIHPRLRSQEKNSKKSNSHSQEKRKSHTLDNDSYEMPHRRDFGGENPQEDEARLCPMIPEHSPALESDGPMDTESVDSSADQVPPVAAKPKPALASFSTKRSQSVNGIQVTRETVITYGPKD
ncbi:integral membrane protein PTH11 [Fusarium subglutinans]|uniref:Integral membrane protein PTH11 n=1 Tax=Gibberella subglutinans TaxID=42677 RepID=A0A8H5QCB5_GIBSU|nr:integral membrane protein PTH11 [Fusarium subglutinans]KAF5613795.1 integral membrane protein PTH11 [Fusarium subglutinans]